MDEGNSQFHYGLDNDLLKLRNQKGRIEGDFVRHGKGTRQIRLIDSWSKSLQDWFISEGVLDSAFQLAECHRAIVQSMDARVSNPEAIRGSHRNGGMSDFAAENLDRYTQWYNECKRQYLAPKLCVDLVCYEIAHYLLDRENKLKRGTARDRTVKCLGVWAGMPR